MRIWHSLNHLRKLKKVGSHGEAQAVPVSSKVLSSKRSRQVLFLKPVSFGLGIRWSFG